MATTSMMTSLLFSSAYERDTQLVCVHGAHVVAEKDPWDEDMKSCVLYVNPVNPPSPPTTTTTAMSAATTRLRAVLHIASMLKHMSSRCPSSTTAPSVGCALLCCNGATWTLLQAWNSSSLSFPADARCRVVSAVTGEEVRLADVFITRSGDDGNTCNTSCELNASAPGDASWFVEDAVRFCFRAPAHDASAPPPPPRLFFGVTRHVREYTSSLIVEPRATAELVWKSERASLFRDAPSAAPRPGGLVPVVNAWGFVVEFIKVSEEAATTEEYCASDYWVRLHAPHVIPSECSGEDKASLVAELRWLLSTKATAPSGVIAAAAATVTGSSEQLVTCTDAQWSVFPHIISSLRELASSSSTAAAAAANPLVAAVVLRRTRDMAQRVITAADLHRRLDDPCLRERECDGFIFDVLLRGSPMPTLASLPPEWHPSTYFTAGDAGFLSILYLLQWRSTVQRFLELAVEANFESGASATTTTSQSLLRSLLSHFRVGVLWESAPPDDPSFVPTCSEVRVAEEQQHIFFFNPSRESMMLRPLVNNASACAPAEWLVVGSLQTQYAKERDSVVAFFMAQALALVARVVRSCLPAVASASASPSVESVLVGMYIGSQQDVDLKHTYKQWQRVVREFRQTIPSRKRRPASASASPVPPAVDPPGVIENATTTPETPPVVIAAAAAAAVGGGGGGGKRSSRSGGGGGGGGGSSSRRRSRAKEVKVKVSPPPPPPPDDAAVANVDAVVVGGDIDALALFASLAQAYVGGDGDNKDADAKRFKVEA